MAALALTASACSTGVDAGNTATLTGPVPAHPVAVTGAAIRGRVLAAAAGANTGGDRAVVAGATVVVTVILRRDEVAGRALKGTLTLGLGCLDRVGCTAPTSEGRVAQDGRFEVAVPIGQTEQDDLSLTVLAQRGSTGRVGTTVTLPYADHVGADVGTIPLATSAGSVVAQGGVNRYVPAAMPGASGAPGVTMSRAASVAGGDQFVVEDPVQDVSPGYNPQLVEDGRVLLASTTIGSVELAPAVFTSSLLVEGTLVPPSRGAACSVEGSTGQSIAQHPCGLTNGMLDSAWPLQDDQLCQQGPCPGTVQNQARDVTVTLSHPVRSGLIVVRGCGFTCQVAWSADGTTFGSWRQAPQDGGTGVVFAVPVPDQMVAAVRVQTATGGFFTALRQVSVWGA